MSSKVFLSYAARDQSLVPRLLDQLKQRQLLPAADPVFSSHKDIAAGADFRDATRAAIDQVDTVVVLWSTAAAQSKWVNYELAMADALGKQLFVVSPHGEHTDLPIDIASAQNFELMEEQ